MGGEMQQYHESEIQRQFEAIEDILRDEAHEGIGEAIHDLRNMVTKLEVNFWTNRSVVKKALALLNAAPE